ncbi:uncharacterized protein RB166_007585 isoform 2-T2 [Leptodactylus fuscus]|uniref:uncharacterized protein LOC142204709 isoform X2 n=1 Tax=Leptodactylus fuscus TaxID=238119 RepID=UPI003F4E8BBB
MRRLLLALLYFLDRVGSEQQPSSLLDLNLTEKSPNSYLVFCTHHISEERVIQVHWKEKFTNGTYSVMAVLNPHWGNYTKFPYQEAVKLHKTEGKTYMMEIIALEICVCCEVVTFPSGSIYEKCLSIEEDTGVYKFPYAVFGILLVGGFFVLGSIILICHICWMRKSYRVFNLRSARCPEWNRSQRSQVPYRRTSPSINLAYDPPHDPDLLRSHLQHPPPTIQLPSEDLPARNPTMNNHWAPEDPTPLSAPPLRNHAVREPHQVYGNIHHCNRKYPKVRHLKSLQIETTLNQHPQDVFPYESSASSSTITHYHTKSCPWLFEGTSRSSEDLASPRSSRLSVPRTPDSPFTTLNPMYHSGAGWCSHPNNGHRKYEHSMI